MLDRIQQISSSVTQTTLDNYFIETSSSSGSSSNSASIVNSSTTLDNSIELSCNCKKKNCKSFPIEPERDLNSFILDQWSLEMLVYAGFQPKAKLFPFLTDTARLVTTNQSLQDSFLLIDSKVSLMSDRIQILNQLRIEFPQLEKNSFLMKKIFLFQLSCSADSPSDKLETIKWIRKEMKIFKQNEEILQFLQKEILPKTVFSSNSVEIDFDLLVKLVKYELTFFLLGHCQLACLLGLVEECENFANLFVTVENHLKSRGYLCSNTSISFPLVDSENLNVLIEWLEMDVLNVKNLPDWIIQSCYKILYFFFTIKYSTQQDLKEIKNSKEKAIFYLQKIQKSPNIKSLFSFLLFPNEIPTEKIMENLIHLIPFILDFTCSRLAELPVLIKNLFQNFLQKKRSSKQSKGIWCSLYKDLKRLKLDSVLNESCKESFVFKNHQPSLASPCNSSEMEFQNLFKSASSSEPEITNSSNQAHSQQANLPLPDDDTIEILCELLSLSREEAISILREHNNLLSSVLNALY